MPHHDLFRATVARLGELRDGDAASLGEREVGDPGVVLKIDVALVEPRHQRPHDGVILVVPGSIDARHRVERREQVDESVEVSPKLDGAVPWIEGERRAPHVPEARGEEMRTEAIGDAFAVEQALGHRDALDQIEPVALREAHGVELGDPPGLVDQPRLVAPAKVLMELEGVLGHRLRRVVQGWDRSEQVIRAAKLQLEHAAASHGVARGGSSAGVEAPALPVLLLQNMNIGAVEMALSNEEGSRGEPRDATANYVCLCHDD